MSLLQGLPEQKLAKIVDCLEVVSVLALISMIVVACNICLDEIYSQAIIILK